MAGITDTKFLDQEGVASLWNRIKDRYDDDIKEIVNSDESTQITSKNKIAVRISPARDNALKLYDTEGEEGLYVPPLTEVHAQNEKLIFGGHGHFVYDGSQQVTVPVYTGEIL